jgi:photosystem II stability/assembly factor-like uncharacterized protein
MKKIVIFSFIVASFIAKGQWLVNFNDQNITFKNIQFINNLEGFAIGDRINTGTGVLLKTNNAGLSWQETALPLNFVSRLYFFNNLYGYVVKGGAPVKLIATNDGGTTWNLNTLDSCYAVTGLSFINASTGYYLNNDGRLRGINNSGVSYTYLSDTLAESGLLLFPDPSTGYAAQGNYMLKSTSAGNTWFYLPTNLTAPLQSNALAFTSPNIGYVSTQTTSGPNIYKTINGAQSWQQAGNKNASVIAAHTNYCMAVNNDSLKIIFTDNAAASWSLDPLPSQFIGAVDGAITPNGNAYLINEGIIFKRTPFINTTGLSESSGKNNSLTIYPNPVSDKLTIVSGSTTLFGMYNCLGELVLTTKNGEINVSDLPKGVYLVKSIDAQSSLSTHFIKE